VRTLVIGHRGAAAHVLENTAASFEQAVSLGVDMIELDVRESLDGDFIVIHDTHVGRISNRRDIIRRTPTRILRGIELHGNHRLLTLAEAFRAIPLDIGVMVEIKAIRSLERMAELLGIEANRRRVLATSFDLTLLSNVQRLNPDLAIGVVSKTTANLLKARIMGLKFENICLDFRCVTRSRLPQLKEKFGRVFVWTVDRATDITRMLLCGVDGIISNRPDEVCRVMQMYQAEVLPRVKSN
jgi:glycerophosphoryl diester phosphodiesterase